MISFGGAPYIDLRVDFNSFLPAKLPIKIQKKAISFYLKKIKKNPKLHDKIEFDVIETCYDFFSKLRLSEFLNSRENKIYIKCLKDLLNNTLDEKKFNIKKRSTKNSNIREKIKTIKNNKISDIQKIYFYVKYCKMYGTLPFAGIARCAFISTKLLRSMLDKKIISSEDNKKFYESINTITKKYVMTFNLLKKTNTKKNIFRKFWSS